ncbi:hypothetical protein NDU88_000939 [Pleurodeles waltl]|uniref:Uncharacterized protein n=1 Tax=Pleurodeles waltl TaxID=8319 RepID=A0AAV7SY24_PLEWA|nr:hypothetical protein NDU88_000939 [Pleurodeles waltl]
MVWEERREGRRMRSGKPRGNASHSTKRKRKRDLDSDDAMIKKKANSIAQMHCPWRVLSTTAIINRSLVMQEDGWERAYVEVASQAATGITHEKEDEGEKGSFQFDYHKITDYCTAVSSNNPRRSKRGATGLNRQVLKVGFPLQAPKLKKPRGVPDVGGPPLLFPPPIPLSPTIVIMEKNPPNWGSADVAPLDAPVDASIVTRKTGVRGSPPSNINEIPKPAKNEKVIEKVTCLHQYVPNLIPAMVNPHDTLSPFNVSNTSNFDSDLGAIVETMEQAGLEEDPAPSKIHPKSPGPMLHLFPDYRLGSREADPSDIRSSKPSRWPVTGHISLS